MCDHQESENCLLLFTSDRREIYKQGVYNTLAYPPKFVRQYRYRDRWKQSDVDISKLEGRTAIVVACVERANEHETMSKEDGKYDFFPLRQGQVKRTSRNGGASQIYLELGEGLVDYAAEGDDPEAILNQIKKYSEAIGAAKYRPYTSDPENACDVFFSEATEKIDLTWSHCRCRSCGDNSWRNADDEWISIVEALSQTPTYSSSLFYRISQIEMSSIPRWPRKWLYRCRNIDLSVKDVVSSVDTGYELASSQQYQIELSLSYSGDPPDDARFHTLAADGSPGVDVFPRQQSLGFSVNESRITVEPTPSRRDKYAEITLGVNRMNRFSSGDDDSSSTATSELRAPEIRVPATLKASWKSRFLPLGAIFLGILFLTGYEFVSWLTWWILVALTSWLPDVFTETQYKQFIQIVSLAITTYGFNLLAID